MKGTMTFRVTVAVLLIAAAFAGFFLMNPNQAFNASSSNTAASSITATSIDAAKKTANPKVQAALNELSRLSGTGDQKAAADFADGHGLRFKDNKVQVVVEAAEPQAESSPDGTSTSVGTAETATAITGAGGATEAAHGNLIQAAIPPERIAELAESPAVKYIRQPARPTTFAVTSEGVADIGAPAWHSGAYNGAGVKIAILDPGFAGYTQRIAAGDLPANVITRSFMAGGDISGGGESHGTGCAEIVYDVAPGAQLYLVNFNTDVELGNAIDYLIAEGVDVVSASWGFYGSFRGDGQGLVNDMVQQANAAGIFWANASGNAAQTHWSGAFTDSNSDTWHEFAVGDGGNDVTASAGTRIDVYLTWDRWPATDQDYDMYLVYEGQPDRTVAAGDNWQSGTQAPAEEMHYTVPPGKSGRYWVVIKNYSATGDAGFHLYAHPSTLQYQVAAGSLGGQPTDSPYAMTVGAVPVGSNTIEYFSSRGPTRDGRLKPDIVAPDRVSTATYGPAGFWGTSAATPHVAGAGALVKGAYASYTPAAIQGFLESRATDLGATGKDSTYGSGKLALGTVLANPDCTKPNLSMGSPQPFWASYADYEAGQLSVNWSLCDAGQTGAFGIRLEGTVNTASVVSISPFPVFLEDIATGSGACQTSVLKYQLPPGVSYFKSTTYATAHDFCGTSYAYPSVYPGT